MSNLPLPLMRLARRKYEKNYVEKRETDSGSVRIYDKSHVAKRWKKKIDRLEKLRRRLPKLGKKYREDLKSDDPKVVALAAIVALMDLATIRVGNDDSVDEFGTFGATTLKKKHVKINGNKVSLHFLGKAQVDQKHEFSDALVASKLKELLKDKKPNDFVFEYEPGKRIRAKVVNRYLADFEITAKDLRGFHANQMMKDELKHNKDWDSALENVADQVGHESKTLERQYLDPKMVEKYKKASVDMTEVINSAVRDIFGGGFALQELPKSPALTRKAPTAQHDHDHDDAPKSRYKITSHFGKRKDPITGRPAGHKGTDIGVPVGTPVYAFASGIVEVAGPKGGFGIAVYLRHGKNGELRTIYGHLSKVLVQPGQHVARSQQIALSGNTGRSTAAHLHFQAEKIENGTARPVNAEQYLSQRPVV